MNEQETKEYQKFIVEGITEQIKEEVVALIDNGKTSLDFSANELKLLVAKVAIEQTPLIVRERKTGFDPYRNGG